MKETPDSPDLPPPNLTAAAAETTRCNSANRPRKIIIKWGGLSRIRGFTTNDTINTAANATVDSSAGIPQSPLEPTVTHKRRKRNNAEPERDQSCTPWIAPSPPPPTLHDLDETREKPIHDLKTSVDAIKHENFSKEDNQKPPEPTPPSVVTAAVVESSPNGLKINKSIGLQIKDSICDGTAENVWKGRTRRRSCNKKERTPFRFALTAEEIEEDFMMMMTDGHRPQRRLKRRPRDLQKQLDDLVPGLRLTEVKADLYKISNR